MFSSVHEGQTSHTGKGLKSFLQSTDEHCKLTRIKGMLMSYDPDYRRVANG